MLIGVKPGQWGWTYDELVAAWRAADDVGFDLLGCFDHVSAAPTPLPWDAATLLTAMAGATEKVELAVRVLNVSLRHPFLLASQIALAQAASGGRVSVGLGTGSYHLARHDHGALGVPLPSFRERVELLSATCQALPRLWRGETVDDPLLGLHGASLGTLGIVPPPLVVGGTSGHVVEVAARHADGWNAALSDPAVFASHATRVRDAARRADRERPLRLEAQVTLNTVEPRRLRTLVRDFEDAGADVVLFVVTKGGAAAVHDLAAAVL